MLKTIFYFIFIYFLWFATLIIHAAPAAHFGFVVPMYVYFLPLGVLAFVCRMQYTRAGGVVKSGTRRWILYIAGILILIVLWACTSLIFISGKLSYCKFEDRVSESIIVELRKDTGVPFIVTSGKNYTMLIFPKNMAHEKALDQAVKLLPSKDIP